MTGSPTTYIKRAALLAVLAGVAVLIVFVLRTDRIPGLPMPDFLDRTWGRTEPLKQQTQERVRDIDAELASH